jgi:hypothetical protein
MRNTKILIVIYLLLFKCFFYSQDPDVFTSTKVGVWNDNTVTTPWSYSGTDADGIPDKDDEVIINHDITSSPDDYTKINKITLNTGASIILDPNYYLMFYGQYETSLIDGDIIGPGLIIFALSHTLSGSGSLSNFDLQVNSWYCYFDVDISTNSVNIPTTGGFQLSTGRTLTSNGSFVKSRNNNLVNNLGTFVINDPNFMTTGKPPEEEFYSTNGNIIYNTNGELPVPFDGGYKDVTINGNVSFDGDISLSGDFTNSNVLTASSAGNTLTFNGSSNQNFSGGINNLKRLVLNNSLNNLNISATSTINIEEYIESQSGTFNNLGTLVLKSNNDNAAGMLKVSNFDDFLGDLTVERKFTTSSNGWVNVASSIKNTNITDWDSQFIFCGDYTNSNYSYSGCGNFSSIYFYDENEANGGSSSSDGWVYAGQSGTSYASYNGAISPGIGTLIYANNGSSTLSKTGVPELGNSSNQLSVTVKSSGSASKNGWNLVSNPFPCSIDYNLLRNDNSFLPASYYIVNNGSFQAGTGTIPHSQGFVFKSTSSSDQTLTFDLDQLTTNDSQFYKSINGVNRHLNIKVSGDVNDYEDQARLFADNNFSNNYDLGEDCHKMFSMYPDYSPSIYFLDNQQNFLERSCINNNFSEDVYFDVVIGSYAQGIYTLNIENISQFMIGSCIKLEDLHTGIITDLRSDSIYSFSSDSSSPSPRFKLNIDVSYDINVSNSTCFNDSSANILISGPINGSIFSLIDSNGLIIDSITAAFDTIAFNNLDAGVYNLSTNDSNSCSLNNHDIIITQPDELISHFSYISDTVYLDSSGSINVLFRNNSINALNYIWDFGDGTTSNDFNTNHTFINQGVYNIKLTAKNDSIGTCIDVFQKNLTIINPLITSDIMNDNYIKNKVTQVGNRLIIPNSLNHFTKVELIDLSGRLKVSNNFKNNIDVSDFNEGVYLIRFSNYKKNLSQKIFISNFN